MYQPNHEALLILLYILLLISSIQKVIFGLAKVEKSTRFDTGDVIIGIGILIALIFIVVK